MTYFQKRLEQTKEQMKQRDFSGLIVSDPYSIRYLTGIWNNPYERMYVLYLDANGNDRFFINKLFNVPKNDFEEVWYSDTDNYVKLLADNINKKGIIGIDKTFSARFLIPLMEINTDNVFKLGSACIDSLRSCKDEEEIKIMKQASSINDTCIKKAFSFIKAGITEKQTARYIEEQFLNEGAQGASFETIVSFGANAADPHHQSDNTILKAGDCVLIDMGCIKNGYCSDMTRTCFFKTVSQKHKEIHKIVQEANEKAESIIKPGIELCELDKAARNHIENAGFGKFFTHRLGHFIGQTDHEMGDISGTNTEKAKEGMIFSIEPGIYIPDEVGVRIEDLVLVTKDGCEILNKVPKELKILD